MKDVVRKLERDYNFLETCHQAVRNNEESDVACIGDVLIAAMNDITDVREKIEGAEA